MLAATTPAAKRASVSKPLAVAARARLMRCRVGLVMRASLRAFSSVARGLRGGLVLGW